jgi:hypothetical protein
MRILEIDIETAPSVAYVWRMFKENVGIDQMITPGYTICYAAKWRGEDEVLFDSLYQSDKRDFLLRLFDLLDEADVVIHYNGKKFDMPTINKEFIKAGMLPPSPYKQVDLYWVVRKNFRFESNKLDYVARQLGIGAKVSHKGFTLWKDCMAALEYNWGEYIPWELDQAWKDMEEYNREDTELLDRLYDKLLPWIDDHPNHALWVESGTERVCPNCGGTHLVSKGYKRTSVLTYRQYHCLGCGKYPRERLAEKTYRGSKQVLRG